MHTTKTRTRQTTVGLVAVSAAMFVAANGAIAAPTPAPSTRAPIKPVACALTPGVDKSTIRIGLMSARTGPAAPFFAGFNEAANLRFAQENAKGGVNGRKIITTPYDDQASGATQAAVATKAVQQDDMFGLMLASIADTMFPFLKQNNIPVIGLVGLPAYGTDSNLFGITGGYSSHYRSTTRAKRLANAGVTKIGMISFPAPGAVAQAAGMDTMVPLEGMSVVARISDAPTGAFDATSTALRLRNASADGIYTVLLVDGGVSVMQALKQQGLTIGNGIKAALVEGLSDPATIKAAGPSVEGAIGATQGTVPVGVPGRPGLRTYTNGMLSAGLNPYGANAPLGYAGADTYVKALRAAGPCPTRIGLEKALKAAKSFDGAGLLPAPINYKTGLTPNGDPALCDWFVTAKNGLMVPDAKATCGKVVDMTTGKVVLS